MFTMIVILSLAALIVGGLGVITAPVPSSVQPTIKPIQQLGGTFKSALTGPLPVRIAATGVNGPLVALVERADGANKNRGFWGIAITNGVDVGSVLDEEPVGAVNGCIIDGYVGVVPGSNVWVDATALPSPLNGFSGLTHTDPADGTPPVGFGVTTTKIYIFTLNGAH